MDFVLAYTQDDAKSEIYMDPSFGFGVYGAHTREWIIRLDKNLYGLKYADLSRFEELKEDLDARIFVQSKVDPCVWYK